MTTQILNHLPDELLHGVQAVDQFVHAPVDTLKERGRAVEAALRDRFGGYDKSLTKESLRKRQLERYRALFDLLDDKGRGAVPIDELEDCFGEAHLFEARTEVGQLAYDADVDGNGALDFHEFSLVIDQLNEYTKDVAPLFSSNKQQEEGGDGAGSGGDGARGTGARGTGGGGVDEEEAAVVGGSDAALSRSILRQHAAAASVNDGPEVSFLFGTEGASLTMRDVIFKTFDDPTFSPLAKTLAVILVTAVFLAIITFVLQTEPLFDGFEPYFSATEGFCVTVFLVDYGTRLATCPSLKAFLFSAANTLDLLTILPYFLDEVNEAFHPKGGFGGAVRILRVFRIFRIFRVTKYIPYVNLMSAAFRDSVAALAMAGLILMIGILLLAMSAFYAERGTWDADQQLWINAEGKPSSMQDVGTAIYWCIISLTTVGYGDVFPTTPAGKLVGAVCDLMGCLIISFPVAIYTDEFGKQYTEFEKKRALQRELGGADLVVKLLMARYEVIQRPEYPRFPPKQELRAYRSIAQPRNVQMMRWARKLAWDRVADPDAAAAEEAEADRRDQEAEGTATITDTGGNIRAIGRRISQRAAANAKRGSPGLKAAQSPTGRSGSGASGSAAAPALFVGGDGGDDEDASGGSRGRLRAGSLVLSPGSVASIGRGRSFELPPPAAAAAGAAAGGKAVAATVTPLTASAIADWKRTAAAGDSTMSGRTTSSTARGASGNGGPRELPTHAAADAAAAAFLDIWTMHHVQKPGTGNGGASGGSFRGDPAGVGGSVAAAAAAAPASGTGDAGDRLAHHHQHHHDGAGTIQSIQWLATRGERLGSVESFTDFPDLTITDEAPGTPGVAAAVNGIAGGQTPMPAADGAAATARSFASGPAGRSMLRIPVPPNTSSGGGSGGAGSAVVANPAAGTGIGGGGGGYYDGYWFPPGHPGGTGDDTGYGTGIGGLYYNVFLRRLQEDAAAQSAPPASHAPLAAAAAPAATAVGGDPLAAAPAAAAAAAAAAAGGGDPPTASSLSAAGAGASASARMPAYAPPPSSSPWARGQPVIAVRTAPQAAGGSGVATAAAEGTEPGGGADGPAVALDVEGSGAGNGGTGEHAHPRFESAMAQRLQKEDEFFAALVSLARHALVARRAIATGGFAGPSGGAGAMPPPTGAGLANAAGITGNPFFTGGGAFTARDGAPLPAAAAGMGGGGGPGGGGGGAPGGGAGFGRVPLHHHQHEVLLPESFSYLDLTKDSAVETAMLELVSDHRKRIWTEIRSLEAKFRDDVCVEVARRWAAWMSMPVDAVADVAAEFVFRKHELNHALRFNRDSLGIGLVRKQATPAASPSPAHHPQQHQPGDGGAATADAATAGVDGGRRVGDIAGITGTNTRPASGGLGLSIGIGGGAPSVAAVDALFQDMLVAPAKSAAATAATTVKGMGGSVMGILPGVFQPAHDTANYQARIAAQYSDILGADVPLNITHKLDRSAMAAAAKATQSVETAHPAYRDLVRGLNSTGKSSADDTDDALAEVEEAANRGGGGDGEEDGEEEGGDDAGTSTAAKHGKSSTDAADGHDKSGHHPRARRYFAQTAFGVSVLPEHLPVVDSSIRVGSASVLLPDTPVADADAGAAADSAGGIAAAGAAGHHAHHGHHDHHDAATAPAGVASGARGPSLPPLHTHHHHHLPHGAGAAAGGAAGGTPKPGGATRKTALSRIATSLATVVETSSAGGTPRGSPPSSSPLGSGSSAGPSTASTSSAARIATFFAPSTRVGAEYDDSAVMFTPDMFAGSGTPATAAAAPGSRASTGPKDRAGR